MTSGPLSHQHTIPDLSPSPGSDIEWWFLQGWIEGPDVTRRHVMTSLFRICEPGRQGTPGAMLLQHVLDPDSGSSWTDSRITNPTQGAHAAIAGQVAAANFPWPISKLVLWRHHRDMADWMRHAGLVVDPGGPRITTDPLSAVWNGFSLNQTGDRFDLKLSAGSDFAADLTLSPSSGWLTETSTRLDPRQGTSYGYNCCPRLTAEGHLGDNPVTGQFWMDRQWGSYEGWLLAPKGGGYRVLGWDWFGLNLDDGRDLLIWRHRMAASHRALASWAVIFDAGVPRPAGAVEARPVRFWTSPQSGAHYPLGWNIDLPDLGMAVQIEPLVENQEIPVYGTTAIWEGAVGVTGTDTSGDITGTGRLELVGYGSPLTIGDHFRRNASRFLGDVAASLGRRRARWRTGARRVFVPKG